MKILCTVEEPCEHPASGLTLRPGVMEVSSEQGAAAIAAGLATAADEEPREE
jgi:hypothetical protein